MQEKLENNVLSSLRPMDKNPRRHKTLDLKSISIISSQSHDA